MKLSLIIFVSLFCILSSCKKEYTCTCYDHFGNADTTSQIEAKNSEEALDKCGENINFGQHASCGIGQ